MKKMQKVTIATAMLVVGFGYAFSFVLKQNTKQFLQEELIDGSTITIKNKSTPNVTVKVHPFILSYSQVVTATSTKKISICESSISNVIEIENGYIVPILHKKIGKHVTTTEVYDYGDCV